MLLLRVRWLLTRFHDSQKQHEKDAHLKTSMDLMQDYQVKRKKLMLLFVVVVLLTLFL